MKTYYRRTEEERTKDYLSCMPYLTIFSESPERVRETEELRKKQVLDTVKLLGFPEDKIKRVEEALAKFATVDDAMEEIRKLSLEDHKVRGNPTSDPKIIDESSLEVYLTQGWDIQTVLPSGRILVKGQVRISSRYRAHSIYYLHDDLISDSLTTATAGQSCFRKLLTGQ